MKYKQTKQIRYNNSDLDVKLKKTKQLITLPKVFIGILMFVVLFVTNRNIYVNFCEIRKALKSKDF